MTRSRSARTWPGLLVVAALALGGCAGGQSASLTPVSVDGVQRIELAVAGDAVTGGAGRWSVPLGSTVEVVVGSDVADEVHLHGYDRSAFVTAGATATIRFDADVPGVFEVELEQSGTPLAQLEVS